jgi:hypothetical protein
VLSFTIAANTDDKKATITDALEILMYLAGMESKAAPGSTIDDALEILIALAGLNSTHTTAAVPVKFPGEPSAWITPIVFLDAPNDDYKSAIINKIAEFKQNPLPDRPYGIANITEFYFPAALNNYELFNVSACRNGFIYNYTSSVNPREISNRIFPNDESCVRILITRWENWQFDGTAAEFIEELVFLNQENRDVILTEDGFVYLRHKRTLYGVIDDTLFCITVRSQDNASETLTSIARWLIDTAELVTVQTD